MPTQSADDNELLTSAEVREILGIDKFRLSRMIHSGQIHPQPFDTLLSHPRPYRFSRQEIKRVLALREERAQRYTFDTPVTGGAKVAKVAEERTPYNAAQAS